MHEELRRVLHAPVLNCNMSLEYKYFEKIMDIFLNMIINSNFSIKEDEEIRFLQDQGIIIILSRNIYESLYSFIPRVNLGFINNYALESAEIRSEFKSTSINAFERFKNVSIENYYLTSPQPRKLDDYSVMFTNNIISAVYDSIKKPSFNFEDIMVLVELLRALSYRKLSSTSLPSLDQVLPKSKFVPWNSESIHVASWIMNDLFFPVKQVVLNREDLEITDNLHVPKKMIYFTNNQKYAIISRPRDTISPTIEYVASHFAFAHVEEDVPVKMLCSMKLCRDDNIDSTTILQYLNDIHELARECGLKDETYYAVLYCCCSKDDIDKELPKGSIVVGKDTLREVLYPFGASCFLDSNLLK